MLLHLKKLPKYLTVLINVRFGLRATYSKITQTGAITSHSEMNAHSESGASLKLTTVKKGKS